MKNKIEPPKIRPILGVCYCGNCNSKMIPSLIDSEFCSCPNRCSGWISVAPEDCRKMYEDIK